MKFDGIDTFSVSYDRTAKIVSLCSVTMLLAIAIIAHSVLVASASIVVIGLSCAYAPRGYTVSDRSITVRRIIGNVHVPIADLRVVRPAAAGDFRRCTRLFGSGGVFGYFGNFKTETLGKCTWYVTDRSKPVVVISGSKTTVFSPNDVERFVTAIHSVQPAALNETEESMFESLGSDRAQRPGSRLVPAAVIAAVLAIVVVSMLYSPGPPDFTLTKTGLTIHDRFSSVTVSAGAVDVPQVRIVDLDVDTGWQPKSKVKGFSNPFYRSGLFEVANGTTVHLYTTGARRLVILPPKGDGTPVLFEVKQPESFVAQVRTEWANRS